MKGRNILKQINFTILALLLIVLTACSSNEEDSNQASSEASANQTEQNEKQKKDDDGKVAVDKGLLSVEITMPASMLESQKDTEEAMGSVKEQGVKEVTKNEDGSLTFKMSKSVHKEMMNEIGTSIKETVEETKNSEDYSSIQDITTDFFTKFTMVVDQETYENSMDGFAALTLGMSGFYQIYDGADPDKYTVTISFGKTKHLVKFLKKLGIRRCFRRREVKSYQKSLIHQKRVRLF